MVNISANGFAFACKEHVFADGVGKKVVLEVDDFDILEDMLEGSIIRSSDNEGEYIVGCRMPQDSDIIKEYVANNYGE